jgi:hypothetical protein
VVGYDQIWDLSHFDVLFELGARDHVVVFKNHSVGRRFVWQDEQKEKKEKRFPEGNRLMRASCSV